MNLLDKIIIGKTSLQKGHLVLSKISRTYPLQSFTNSSYYQRFILACDLNFSSFNIQSIILATVFSY